MEPTKIVNNIVTKYDISHSTVPLTVRPPGNTRKRLCVPASTNSAACATSIVTVHWFILASWILYQWSIVVTAANSSVNKPTMRFIAS